MKELDKQLENLTLGGEVKYKHNILTYWAINSIKYNIVFVDF